MSRKIAIEITPPLLFPGVLIEDKSNPGVFTPKENRTENIKINGEIIESIEHIGTIFLGSKDIYFSKDKLLLNETIRKSDEDLSDPEYPTSITKIIRKVDIEKDDHLYIKTRLIFKINGVERLGDFSRISVVSGDQKGFTVSDSIVNTPLVTVELENGLTLSTNEMSAFVGTSEHKDSTWAIRTADGELQYIRKDDIDNKLSIKPTINITKNRMYVAEAIHNNLVNVKSNIGRKLFLDKIGGINSNTSDDNTDLLDMYSFSLETPFMHKTNVFYKVKIHVPFFRFYELEIRRSDHTTVVRNLGSLNKYINYFNTSDLELNNVYTIYGRLHRVDGMLDTNHDDGIVNTLESTEWKLLYIGALLKNDGTGDSTDIIGIGDISYPETSEATGGPIINIGAGTGEVDENGNPIDPNELDKNNDGLNDETNEPVIRRTDMRSYTTYEFKDGTIIIPEFYTDDSVMLTLYRYENNMLRRIKPMLSTPLETHQIDHITFVPLNGSQVCVIYNSNGTGVNYRSIKVTKFLYNPVNKMLLEKSTIELKDAQVVLKYATSISTSATYDNEGNIYILGNATVNISNSKATTIKLFKVNTSTETLTKTQYDITLPNNVKIHYFPTLFRDGVGNIYLTSGTDITNPEHVFTSTDQTETFKRSNSKIFKLNKNNNTFTYTGHDLPVSLSNNVYSLQAILRKDHKVVLFNGVYNGLSLGIQNAIVYDPKTGVIKDDPITDDIKAPFLTNICLTDGGIIRITTKEYNPQLSYVYKSSLSTDYTNIDQYEQVHVLVVRNNETIEIEDAYKYDKITIEGNGKLVWADKDEVREYTSADLIITRNTTIKQSEIDKVTGTLLLLNNVSLTIVENA